MRFTDEELAVIELQLGPGWWRADDNWRKKERERKAKAEEDRLAKEERKRQAEEERRARLRRQAREWEAGRAQRQQQAEENEKARLCQEKEEAKEGVEVRTLCQQQAEEKRRRQEKEEKKRQARLSLNRRELDRTKRDVYFGFVFLVLLGLSIWWYFPRAPRSLAAEAKVGTLSVLKAKMAPWTTHWSTVEGRTTLRMASIEAARAGHVDILDCLCQEWKVPINNIPADEKVQAVETPLVAAVLADREDVALHLLSLVKIDKDLTLERKLDRGDTLLHHAARKGQTRLVEMLLRRGASPLVADDGHTALSLAIDKSNLALARIIIDGYRAQDLLESAFEHSFYESRERPVPLLHRVCAQRAGRLRTEEEMLAVVTFLVEQGADVAVRDRWGQTPVDAVSLCPIPFMHLFVSWCRAPSVYWYLQEHLKLRGGEMERQTYREAMKSVAEVLRDFASFSWPWLWWSLWCFLRCFLYCFFGICLGIPFIALVAAGKSPFEPLEVDAAKKPARQRKEHSAKTKKRQKGKHDKKQKGKSERCEPGEEDEDEHPVADERVEAVAAVEVKKKAKKKRKKNKQSGGTRHAQQELPEEAAVMPEDVEEEEVGAKTQQEEVEAEGSAFLFHFSGPNPDESESDDGGLFYDDDGEEEGEGEEQ
jgi:hypothetical protein